MGERDVRPAPSPLQGSSAAGRDIFKAERPWYKKKRYWLLIIVVLAVIGATGGGGDDKADDTSSATQDAETTSSATDEEETSATQEEKTTIEPAKPGYVSKADLGDDWPLKVDAGVLACEGEDGFGQVAFTAPDGTLYGTPGPVATKDIRPIWAKDPDGARAEEEHGPAD